MDTLQSRLRKTYKRIIQLELNEISKDAIDRLIQRGKLPNFNKINQNWTYYQTTSEQQYEHLEPWIQWTTAHTGKSFSEHGVFRLSDATHLTHPQIWETLSNHNIESCVVGSMNAVRGKSKGGFFFPDPWSKDGITHPDNIQPLWNLISKKVQSHATHNITINDLLAGLRICQQFKLPLNLYRKIATQFISQKIDKKTQWKLSGIFDLFLFEIFKHLLNARHYQYYTLFLNAVAHYQHHYWRNFQNELFNNTLSSPDCKPKHDPITYGLEIYDKIIGRTLKYANDPDTLVIIASGLAQEPFTQKEDEGGMNYYRLYNHNTLMKQLGLNTYRVLPMMSRDWQIQSDTQEHLDHARNVLATLHVNNEPVFTVTQNTPNSLFIETAITRKLNRDALIKDQKDNTIGIFNHCFHRTAVKSGHHIGEGSMWISTRPENQEKQHIRLTDLYPFTLEAFGTNSLDFERNE